jgi:hypothetical protein
MRFCYLACLARINSVKQHIFEKLRYAAYFSGDLFKIFFLKFNFLSEYFFYTIVNSLELFRVFWFPFREVKLGDVRVF